MITIFTLAPREECNSSAFGYVCLFGYVTKNYRFDWLDIGWWLAVGSWFRPVPTSSSDYRSFTRVIGAVSLTKWTSTKACASHTHIDSERYHTFLISTMAVRQQYPCCYLCVVCRWARRWHGRQKRRTALTALKWWNPRHRPSRLRTPWGQLQSSQSSSRIWLRIVKPVACRSVQHDQVQLCRGHSLATWCTVWFAAPHSHDADGDSYIWFMLYPNLPYPVPIRFRRYNIMMSCLKRISRYPLGGS